MKVIQVTSRILDGDSITNCILYISSILDNIGVNNCIAAYSVNVFRPQKKIVFLNKINDLDIDDNDIVFYHLFSGTSINLELERFCLKKILIYHNITPPDFFRDIDIESMKLGLSGKMDVKHTKGNYLKAITLSEYSKKELVQYGWNEKDIHVIPLILSADKTGRSQACDEAIVEKYDDGMTNILFVGRVVMNKKIEDIVTAFEHYNKKINSASRLIIVGAIFYKTYYDALCDLIGRRSIPNVVFTGMVSDEELNAYYSVADIYLSLSEHEGFCMPIIEAMERRIPVIAYASSAVPETMGNAGVLLYDKTSAVVADEINKLVIDLDYRKKIVNGELRRIENVYLSNFEEEIKSIITEVCEIENYVYDFESKMEKNGLIYRDCKDEENINDQIMEYIGGKDTHIVIYGAGKVGTKLIRLLKAISQIHIDAICDNNISESEKFGIPVLKHNDCIVAYPNSLYIVSVQKEYLRIVKSLVKSGINDKNVIYYDLKKDRLIY